MKHLLTHPARLRRDRRAATAVEFALLAPMLLGVIMMLGDLMYQGYVQAVLDGAMIKAGRDSALEVNKSTGADLDERVKKMVGIVGPGAQYSSSRSNYESFSLVKPENFTDSNNNGRRDAGECFDDVNGNKMWDADPGDDGQGGANDVTKYTMRLTMPRMFPASSLFGLSRTMTIVSTTLLKNQPYQRQSVSTIQSVCT